ncbi:MAG: YebC/PmpR family DNA-binding transcriptional regulator [Planctomycetota bacterium]
MAGHSHAKNVKHRKDAVDSKRGKLFSKLSKKIIAAAKQGGGDINANITLRTMVEKARDASMPKENIERAIKRATGELGGGTEEITYEGYGPGGAAILVQACTDNRSRTASNVRLLFDRAGGKFAASGSVSWIFKPRCLVTIDASTVPEEDLLAAVLEAGADDMTTQNGVHTVSGPSTAFASVLRTLESKGWKSLEAELTWIPDTRVSITTTETAKALLDFITALEEDEDITAVHSNHEFPEGMDWSEDADD